MKNFIVFLLLSLLRDGVFGADEMKKEETEGDSLTLPTGLTEIKSSNQILWLYGPDQTIIAKIDGGNYIITVDDDDERFKGKLELDKQTGSLTIKNIKIKNSGLYQLVINRATTPRKFSVTVYAHLPTPAIESPQCSPTPVGSSSRKCVFLCSVQTSDQATLSWYRGNSLVSSKITESCSSISLPLEANYEDENIYSCIVNNPISNKTQHLNITQLCQPCPAVPDPGLSSGAVAGIVVGVLLGVFAVGAAAVIYYRRKISELERQKLVSVPVKEGDPVTLNTDVNEIQGDDQIEWRFGNGGHLIAQIKGGTSTIYNDVLDGRFRGRLKLDKKTGSLTITNTRTTDSGLYKLKISRDSEIKHKKFSVSVCVSVSAIEGDDVTLKTDAEIQRDDQIEWRFGNGGPLIAQIKGGTSTIYDDVLDGKFRGRLKLDDKTGSLTITNTEMKHAGVYELKIKSGSEVSYMKFTVTLRERNRYVKEGKNLTLKTDTEIQRDDQILWMCGENLIAQIKGGTKEMCDDVSGGRFRGRLELDEKTGSLTIKKMRIEESGLYKLHIISSRGTTDKRFFVTVWEKLVSVYEGDPVILVPDTEIHREDQILWLFKERNTEIKGGIREITCDGADGRFKDRLKLDKTTGSLTITNTRTTDSGDYKLQIKSSSVVSYKKIRLHVGRRMISVEEGNPVTIETKAEIQRDDQILWTFEDAVIVQMTGETGGKYDDAKGIFKGRLVLDKKTGSLTIRNMKTEHSGVYKLQIRSSRGTKHLYKAFKVVVVTHGYDTKTVIEGEVVTLPSSTYIEVNEMVQWLFKDETLAIGMDGDISKTSYFNERFRDRLQLDHQTGSLTIKNTRTSDTGHYHLKLLRCGIDRKFSITVSERKISVKKGKNVTLKVDTEIQRDDLILWMCGENLIAQIKGGTKEMCDDVSDGRFRGRLELDETTGSLTIKDIRIEESGLYKLHIISSRGTTYKRFFVTVNVSDVKAPPFPVKKLKSEHRVNESASLLKPQSDREIPDGAKESVTVVMPQSDREIPDGAKESVTVKMPLLSDVNEQQETSSV